jgi:hypothetical protein
MRVNLIAFSVLPLFLSGATWASEPLGTHLESISGKVLINQGEGFVAADSKTTLKHGTKVLVGEGSTAVLSFAANEPLPPCTMVLKPKSVTTVTDSGMCEAQQKAEVGAFEAVQITPVASDRPSGIPPYIVGTGFFTIVAGVAIFTLFDDDDDNGGPVSPP